METTRKNLRRFVSTPLWIVLLLLALGFASALAGSSMDRGESAPPGRTAESRGGSHPGKPRQNQASKRRPGSALSWTPRGSDRCLMA